MEKRKGYGRIEKVKERVSKASATKVTWTLTAKKHDFFCKCKDGADT